MWLLVTATVVSGCAATTPTAKPNTPEWTVQSANIAARKKDWNSYVQFFSPEYQRRQVRSSLGSLAFQAQFRRVAGNLKTGNEVAILRELNVDWDWLDKTHSLPEAERGKVMNEFVVSLANPDRVWVEILRDNPELGIQWAKIESVSTEGDTATAKTKIVGGVPTGLKLRLLNGEWKIDED